MPSQHAKGAEITWDDLSKEDNCDVTRQNKEVISQLSEGGNGNQYFQSLARDELVECNTKLAVINKSLARFEDNTQGAQDLIKEYVLVFQ
jgi:hypothetical protein